MPLLAWILRIIVPIGVWSRYIGLAMAWVWKWFVILAKNPISWIVASLLPMIDLILELTLGVSVGIGPAMSYVITSMLNAGLAYAVDTGYLQGGWNSLPATVLEVSCYIGATEAIEFLFTGIASALASLLSMKITLAIIAWRMSLMKRNYRAY